MTDDTNLDLAGLLRCIADLVKFIDKQIGVETRHIWQRLTYGMIAVTADGKARTKIERDAFVALEDSLDIILEELISVSETDKKFVNQMETTEFEQRFAALRAKVEFFRSLRVSELPSSDYRELVAAAKGCFECPDGLGQYLLEANGTSDQDKRQGNSSDKNQWLKNHLLETSAGAGGLSILAILFFVLPELGITSIWLRLSIVLIPLCIVPFVLLWFRAWTWHRRMAVTVLLTYLSTVAISEINFFVKDGPSTKIGMIVDRYNTDPMTIASVTMLVALFVLLDYFGKKRDKHPS